MNTIQISISYLYFGWHRKITTMPKLTISIFLIKHFIGITSKKDLWAAMGSKLANIAKAPVKFFSSASFLWIWAVYALTYATANVVESIALALGASPATPVLISSTFANMGICLAKDAAFAKMFGSKDKPGQKTAGLSPTVLTLWFGRDVITQFFVFTLPILLTGVVPDLVCRLSAPVGAQYFTTPHGRQGDLDRDLDLDLDLVLNLDCDPDLDLDLEPDLDVDLL